MIAERVLQLRRDQGLLGILTPAPPAKAADVACVLMNAGVVHRIGPHRLNVKMARHLASQGYATVRLDLSGLGDSVPDGTTRSFTDQAIADIRATMDQLQRMNGTRRFIVSGLCSGAAIGFKVALADARVVALQLLDPYAYRNRTATLRYYMSRMRLPEAWPAAVSNMIRPQQANEEAIGLLGDFVRDPPVEEFARGLAALVDRGVSIMCVYTGAVMQVYNYLAQFDEVMEPYGIAGRIRIEHLPESTHTFLDVASQQRLMAITSGWLGSLNLQIRRRA